MQPVEASMQPNQTTASRGRSHVAQPPLNIHVDPLASSSSSNNNNASAFDDHRWRVSNDGGSPAFSPHDLDALAAFDPLGAADSPSTVVGIGAGASSGGADMDKKKPAKKDPKTNATKSKAGKAGGGGSAAAADATAAKLARQRRVASAAKRARRSEIEKQSRQRRMGTVGQMRGELELLENEYLRLVKQQSEARGVIVHPKEVEALRHKYLELSAEARTMRQEQKQLRVMLHERQLFHDSFRAMAVEFSDDDEFPWSAVAHASFEPLTAAKCFEIIRESYEVITRFEVGGNFISSGATYLGWADKRRLDEETSSMHFTFTKRFANQSTEYLMEQSWKTFCNEDDMRKKVFSPAVQVNLEILQVINDDVCVVRRHTKYVSMGKAFHTVYLLFRIQTETGYTVGFRTIPTPGIQNSLEEHESWIDIFHWTHLTRLVDENGDARGCELVFGGSIGSEVMKFAMHWMLELAMTVVRWENACVAPMAIKPSA